MVDVCWIMFLVVRQALVDKFRNRFVRFGEEGFNVVFYWTCVDSTSGFGKIFRGYLARLIRDED